MFVPQSHQLFQAAEKAGPASDEDLVGRVLERVSVSDPFRRTPPDPAKQAATREGLVKDLPGYRAVQPLYRGLEVD